MIRSIDLQRFVVLVPFALAGDPVQHEVGRRHADDLAGIGVERIFARPQGRFPHAAFAAVHPFAVAEFDPRGVAALLAVVADDDAHFADADHFLGNQLDRGEPMIDKIGAVQQRGVLLAAAAAGRQEGFDILIVVVIVLAGGIHCRPAER